MPETIIAPPGQSKGLLYPDRRFKPGDLCGLAREKIEIPPRREWSDILADPDRVLMTKLVKSVFNQASNPSCAAESSTANFKIRRAWQGAPFIEFNPLFNFYHTQIGRGGSSLDDNLEFGREFGYCPESIWPRFNGIRKPSDDAYDAARLYRGDEFEQVEGTEEAGGMLLLGYPFAFGWNGHSCVAMEMIDPEWFWYLNSWKVTWGDKPHLDCLVDGGFGQLRLRDIDEGYGMYAFLSTVDAGTA